MSNRSMATRVMSCSLSDPDPDVISHAAKIIKMGGLVVYPTDTFYGLGGNPGKAETVQRIFQAKGRSKNKPLPLILYNRRGLKDWVSDVPLLSRRLMDIFWPGPLTILFPCAANLSPVLTAGTGKIGLRWPEAPVATAIAQEAGTAVISTSANLSGKGGIIHPDELLKDLEGLVDLIIDSGELPPSLGSTVVDATGDHIRIIREGEIPKDRLQEL